MAITISTIPTVILAKDPLPITFITDNFKTDDGSFASISLEINAPLNDGEGFDITFNSKTLEFLIKDAPDDSGLQIRSTNGGESLSDYVSAALIPALRENIDIVEVFRIGKINPNGFFITALERAEISDLAFAPTGGAAFIGTSIFNGSDITYRNNFRINYEIIDNATNLPISNIEALEPLSDSTVTIDISEIIQGISKNEFIFNSANAYDLLPDNVERIYIRYWESYGLNENATNRKVLSTSGLYLIEGATSWIDQALLNEESKFWWDTISKDTWLTRKPNGAYILPDQPLILFLLNTANYGGTVNFNIESFIGEISQDLKQFSLSNPNQYTIYQFDASPKRHSIADNIEYIEVYYTFGTGNLLSDKLTFYIDRSWHQNIRYFFYRNNFGAFDSLQSVGLGEVQENYKRNRSTLQIPPRFTTKDRETKIQSVEKQLTFKVNLGFLNNYGVGLNAWSNYIRQLYSSLESFEIIRDVIYPIDGTTTKQKLLEDLEFIPDFFEFEYVRAFIEKGATSEIPALQGSYSDQYDESYD